MDRSGSDTSQTAGRSRKPFIALCVMVKNEEATLPRLLASVQNFADHVIALDTGSTDRTLEILAERGAEVLQSPFLDFGRSRTQLMQFAKGKADWLLLLDADHTLRIEQTPILNPREFAYSLQHSGSNRYFIPRILRGDRDWTFVGATHEYLDTANSVVRRMNGVLVDHFADGGSRADKFERDERLLREELERDPLNPRTVFYLANTLRDLGRLTDAQGFYYQRAGMGGWDEEVYVASLEAAKISMDPLELWECWAKRPTRAESLWYLEQAYRDRGEEVYALNVNRLRERIPVPDDVLFVDLNCYGANATGRYPKWTTIPGWWNEEAGFYAKMATLLPKTPDPAHPDRPPCSFVEVGVYLGRSFACFDYFANKVNKRKCHLYAVDTFRGTDSEPTEKAAANQFEGGFRQEFLANMARVGVTEFSHMENDSVSAARNFFPQSIDFVFIDAEHTTEALKADIIAWLPRVRIGGYIGGHDYDRPEVRAAVLAYFDEKQVFVEGRCWVVRVELKK